MAPTFCKFIKLDDTRCICVECKHVSTKCNALKNCKPRKAEEVDAKDDLQPPSLLQRIINFTSAATKHAIAGNPVVSEEVLKERLALCQACPLFKPNQNAAGGVCTHSSCGCNVQDNLNYLNKIAWADQQCPLDPPTWKSQNGV